MADLLGIESLPSEEWKEVVDCRGKLCRGLDHNTKYYVSNIGRVIATNYHGWNSPAIMEGGLTYNKRGKGVRYRFARNGKPMNVYGHHLVAEYFTDWWEPGMEIKHLDGDVLNNRVENLAPKLKRLSESDQEFVREYVYENGGGVNVMARKFGVADTYIKKICGLQ